MQLYLIKSSIILLAVHLFFELVMRKNTPFTINRFYLIIGTCMAFIIPLLKLPQIATPNILYGYLLPEIKVENAAISLGGNNTVSISKVLYKIYLTGALIMILRVLVKLSFLLILYLKGEKHRLHSYQLVMFNKNLSPFTFFRVLFFPNKKNQQVDEALINHEIAHAEELHTIDNLIFELGSIVLWFHPSFWILRIASQQNHEFLADDAVLKKGISVTNYQQLLLAYSLNTKQTLLGNSFNQSAMLKRMKMMILDKKNINKNRKWMSIGFGLILASSAVIYNSCENGEQSPANNQKSLKSDQTSKIEEVAVVGYDQKSNRIEETVYEQVTDMPVFNGKDFNSFRKHIQKSVVYPIEAAKNDIEGRVFVEFVINSNGYIQDAKVVRSVHTLLDAEALRVINESPKWQAGKIDGNDVAVKFTMPIAFILQ